MKLVNVVHRLLLVSVFGLSANAMAEVKVDPNLKVNKPVKSKRSTSGLSYTYGGVQYMNQHLDIAGGCSQDGIQAYGSLYIQDGWFVVASVGDVSGSRCGSSRVSAGGGYRAAYNDQFDMYATLSLETISPDSGGSDSGLVLTGGIRGFLTNEVEGVFELFHSTTGDGTTAVNVGGRYWFKPVLAATLDLGLSSDSNTIQVGARLNF